MTLLRRIETYLRRSGTAATRFGRDSLKDPHLVGDLRNGRELRANTARRLGAHLDRLESALSERS
jgi:2,4-dienoyl-CoA reductase-like NADH-dependent reductase (Old Yellow Enzyme family)